ncbi:response regulator transcription factor [Macrococcus capreoli]|uniref:response regulator transcription factor n=1 Tax=Macrococcus capreoli TaxID=2982690 RepID=UPI0021D5CA31|nr:response regulator transcription factor [Macrococcus sp. TMW 2.2395]MCU7557650.1 response regulator transcription factor [Macrococcus sp. TMW 2.2395]
MRKKNILICDDEQAIIDVLKLYFDTTLYNIYEANDGEAALRLLKSEPIDLALIDIMMPKINGLQLIQLVKHELSIPLLIISARYTLEDKLKGYEIGADDYITKPFEPLEVLAKVKNRLNVQTRAPQAIIVDDLKLDLYECKLTVGQTVFELTKVEFQVLKLLMESPNRVFTKAQIYTAGWDDYYEEDDNSIRVIMNRLREKIGKDRIQTIRGLGYRLSL